MNYYVEGVNGKIGLTCTAVKPVKGIALAVPFCYSDLSVGGCRAGGEFKLPR